MPSREFPGTENALLRPQTCDAAVVVFDDTHYRYQDDGPNGAPLEAFDAKQYQLVACDRYHAHEPGSYPWDMWQRWAIEDGVPEELAGLGRALIRKADQHNWSQSLQDECGRLDSGAAMLALPWNRRSKPVNVKNSSLHQMTRLAAAHATN